MTENKQIVTYSQYNEDLIMFAFLYDVKQGFYIDVGANSPEVDSVTKLFYKRGWHGINIEPIKSYYEDLVKERPNDINLQMGIGSKSGFEVFREYIGKEGHSTFDEKQKKEQLSNNEYIDYKVRVDSLVNILNNYTIDHIHFLKIDVEGFEYQVITGNNWTKYRPEIICIEANHVHQDWEDILLKNKYNLLIFDGLNKYYVAEESHNRTVDFVERLLDTYHQSIQSNIYKNILFYKRSINSLKDQNTQLKEQNTQLKEQNTQLKESYEYVSRASFKGKPLRVRLKLTIYALTIDWYRFKKINKKS